MHIFVIVKSKSLALKKCLTKKRTIAQLYEEMKRQSSCGSMRMFEREELYMKAGIYYGINQVGVETVPTPTISETDVLVKNVRAGICGTDLNAYRYGGEPVGIFPNGEFGHEMVSLVVEVGSKVKDIHVGDRVFVNPVNCKRLGKVKCDIAGAFSEYVCVEDARWGYNLFKLEDHVSFDEAVIIEPFAVGTHGKNVVHTSVNDHVVVYGAGTIGLSAMAAALAQGNKNVVVIDNNAMRLEKVKKLGGIPVNFSVENVQEKLKEYFGTAYNVVGQQVANVDVIIDCAGAPNILADAITNAKEGVRISLLATAQSAVTIYPAMIMSNEVLIKGSCGYEIEDIEEVIDNVNHKKVDLSTIVTHHFSIDQLDEAFAFANDPQNNAIKVVIDYE